MKKQLIAIAAASALALGLAACQEEEKQVQIVSSTPRLRVEVGDEISVTAQTKVSEPIKWSCEDGEIAVITADGKLTGIANGITVVTAKTDSGYDHIGLVVGNGVKGTEVVVSGATADGSSTGQKTYNGNSKITSISLSLNGMTEDETLLLRNNDTATFRVNVTPADCDDPIEFTSSNPGVARVDSDGTVTPVSAGTTVITATAPNGVADTFKIFVR